jgi:hypothetical protein
LTNPDVTADQRKSNVLAQTRRSNTGGHLAGVVRQRVLSDE